MIMERTEKKKKKRKKKGKREKRKIQKYGLVMLLAEEYLKNAGRKMKLRSVCETKHKDIDTREEGDTHTHPSVMYLRRKRSRAFETLFTSLSFPSSLRTLSLSIHDNTFRVHSTVPPYPEPVACRSVSSNRNFVTPGRRFRLVSTFRVRTQRVFNAIPPLFSSFRRSVSLRDRLELTLNEDKRANCARTHTHTHT